MRKLSFLKWYHSASDIVIYLFVITITIILFRNCIYIVLCLEQIVDKQRTGTLLQKNMLHGRNIARILLIYHDGKVLNSNLPAERKT